MPVVKLNKFCEILPNMYGFFDLGVVKANVPRKEFLIK